VPKLLNFAKAFKRYQQKYTLASLFWTTWYWSCYAIELKVMVKVMMSHEAQRPKLRHISGEQIKSEYNLYW